MGRKKAEWRDEKSQGFELYRYEDRVDLKIVNQNKTLHHVSFSNQHFKALQAKIKTL